MSKELSTATELSPLNALADREAIRDGLAVLMDRIDAKRANIHSWDNYGKDTFLAFDSYNLGLTEAYDMLGNFVASMEINFPARETEN